MEINEALLRNLVEQARDRDPALLCAGLTVLAKDAAEYFAATGKSGNDVRLFQNLYAEALDTERQYWQQYGFPVFQPLQDAGLPRGFTAAAEVGQVDLSPIGNQAIVHEWTKFPGRDLLKKFSLGTHAAGNGCGHLSPPRGVFAAPSQKRTCRGCAEKEEAGAEKCSRDH